MPVRSKSPFWATMIRSRRLPGEIIPAREFYDYEAKYVSDDSRLLIPAPLTPDQNAEAQRLAIATFKSSRVFRPWPVWICSSNGTRESFM